jgi:signal transduction histidine kinase
VAWLTAACVLTLVLIVGGTRSDPAFTWVDVAVGPTALVVHFVLVLTGFGIAGDIRAAAVRAETRAALHDSGGAHTRAGMPLGRRLQAIVRELVPGEAEADDAAIEAERARLAGDLHAVVLPSLRRAIADVEAGGTPEALAARLRAVDLELERVMADRWPVVLDAFGLVAAVEELAERVEADDRVRVTLEIIADEGRPPRAVERAAWRIVQLALDNAVRHAAASQLVVSIQLAPGRVTVEVADDGTGLDPTLAGEAARSGGRGLVDLQRRATAVGGWVEVADREPSGTSVRFTWSAA